MFSSRYKFEHHSSIDSTMNRGKELALMNQESIILADIQTAGRGQNGKKWESLESKGVYLTVVIKTPLQATLSLAVGVAVMRVLKNYTDQAFLKWPNDLLVPTKDFKLKKISGILVEYINSAYAVIGIGFNLFKSEGDFENKITLEEINPNFKKMELVAELIKSVEATLKLDFKAILKAYHQDSIFKFGAIFNQEDQKNILGLSPRGALIIEGEGEVFSYSINLKAIEKKLIPILFETTEAFDAHK